MIQIPLWAMNPYLGIAAFDSGVKLGDRLKIMFIGMIPIALARSQKFRRRKTEPLRFSSPRSCESRIKEKYGRLGGKFQYLLEDSY
jgi:hypothetical protein